MVAAGDRLQKPGQVVLRRGAAGLWLHESSGHQAEEVASLGMATGDEKSHGNLE